MGSGGENVDYDVSNANLVPSAVIRQGNHYFRVCAESHFQFFLFNQKIKNRKKSVPFRASRCVALVKRIAALGTRLKHCMLNVKRWLAWYVVKRSIGQQASSHFSKFAVNTTVLIIHTFSLMSYLEKHVMK